MSWLIKRTTPGTVHVLPQPGTDLIEHDLTDTCACGPTPELVPNPTGPDGWLHTHHSLDGREHRESPCA